MRARRFGRWVGRLAMITALGVGVSLGLGAASAVAADEGASLNGPKVGTSSPGFHPTRPSGTDTRRRHVNLPVVGRRRKRRLAASQRGFGREGGFPGSAPLSRLPARRAWWLTVPLAVVTVVFTLLAQIGWQVPGWQWLLGVVSTAAFILVDLTTIHVEVRRHRFGVSVGEVPLLLALLFLSPVTLVVSRSLAALLARLYQRQSWVKVSFNASRSSPPRRHWPA